MAEPFSFAARDVILAYLSTQSAFGGRRRSLADMLEEALAAAIAPSADVLAQRRLLVETGAAVLREIERLDRAAAKKLGDRQEG